jgi:uncharacterized protein YchJ
MKKLKPVLEFSTEVECNAIKEIKEGEEVVKKAAGIKVFAELIKDGNGLTKLTKRCVFDADGSRRHKYCIDCRKLNMDLIQSQYHIDSFGRKAEIVDTSEWKGAKDIGRNDECHCGSGKKYKKCCLN